MSFDSPSARSYGPTTFVGADGFPPSEHPSEADMFCRQAVMPGHVQESLADAHVAIVGCGGLGSWFGVGMARLGVKTITLFDDDRFELSNATRQLMFAGDIGQWKAASLARNLAAHMTNRGTIHAMSEPFRSSNKLSLKGASVIFAGVDNNRARLDVSAAARAMQIPAVFAMLSLDGLRAQTFLQMLEGPCLRCVLPDLQAGGRARCAAASIASCFLAAAHAVQMCAAAIMRSPCPSWRETSLDGTTERASRPAIRRNCPGCGSVQA